jgi:hypothetical protein
VKAGEDSGFEREEGKLEDHLNLNVPAGVPEINEFSRSEVELRVSLFYRDDLANFHPSKIRKTLADIYGRKSRS